NWHAEIALAAYHWTFLAQPSPLPETLIAAAPDFYVDWTLRSWTQAKSLAAFPEASLAAYRAQMADPERVAAFCADYRAGATTDRVHDEADRAAGRRISCPLRFLVAEGGFPAQAGNPSEHWRGWAPAVEASTCRSGHFIMEENPQAALDAFLPFFLAVD
ncbi:MAG: alpha/beta hydrolase, partial [Pseudomonadota bacterium]